MNLPRDDAPDALAAERREMIVEHLAGRGIHDARVLEAMARVPREAFVPSELRSLAYADRALPIDCHQTISQPFIVALMTQALALTGAERVLEIGTGSGYQTAVLAELAQSIVTIERHAELSRQAQRRLDNLGYRNVTFRIGDGTQGDPEHAPFDRILAAAAAHHVPPALYEQLADGGILVLPVGEEEGQMLKQIRREGAQFVETDLSPCRFVPLIEEPQD